MPAALALARLADTCNGLLQAGQPTGSTADRFVDGWANVAAVASAFVMLAAISTQFGWPPKSAWSATMPHET